MTDTQNIFLQVKTNCNISDAKYWGTYSLCGLLLRLRELYRSEKGLRPWESPLQKDVGEWITARETLWRDIESWDLRDISLNGGDVCSPFDVERINTYLNREGLLYGAGFGLYMKPVFFVTDIISHRKIEGFDVYVAGREHVRDLSDYPAMLQDNVIISRVDLTRLLLWNRFEELRGKNDRCKLAFAFSHYGIAKTDKIDEDLCDRISQAALSEAETYVYHELGEAHEGRRLGETWKTFLMGLQHGQAEVFARAVKDVLSDTTENGMLGYIIEKRSAGSLGFYNVFLSGFRKLIFPEMAAAFRNFSDRGGWEEIEEARTAGYRNASCYAERLLAIYEKYRLKPDVAAKRIEEELVGKVL